MINEEIGRILKQSRRWAVAMNKRLGKPYHNDLCGMCGIASAYLLNKLHKAGYTQAVAAMSSEHVFVLIENTVLDVTASQYRLGAIVVLPIKEAQGRRSYSYEPTKKLNSAKELREEQEKQRWPRSQIVWEQLALSKRAPVKVVRQQLCLD